MFIKDTTYMYKHTTFRNTCKVIFYGFFYIYYCMNFILIKKIIVSGSLQIRHSLESDEGKYECVAENSVGVAYSYGANLYVRGTDHPQM